jgi:hypothetical protein
MFKSEQLHRFARAILSVAIANREVWPDEVEVDTIAKSDRNCIGSTWRWLCNIGILRPTAEFRRSQAKGAKGRKIFKYILHDPNLAKTVLGRPVPVAIQTELPL